MGGGRNRGQRERGRAERERERERGGGRERERERTLILKDSSVGSIWTYLTTSPCCTTNTNKHDYTTNRYEREIERERG